MFSTYTSAAGEIEVDARVFSGDIALVPYGYHGPAVAAPGYDLYYLNVMAGPDPERVWLISDDPDYAWVRDTWDGLEFDSRLPLGKNVAREAEADTTDQSQEA
jgi:5-deoxy-glucuronate isomerase